MMAAGRGPGSSEDGALEEEEEEEEEEESAPAENDDVSDSEATSVSSGDSRTVPSPPRNGCPALRSLDRPAGEEQEEEDEEEEEEPRKFPETSTGEAGGGAGGGGGGAQGGGGGASGGGAEEWHKCPECGRAFGTSRALKVHRSYHVGRKRPQAPPPAPATPPPPGSHAPFKFHYICAECGVGFVAPAALGAHRCDHGRRRPAQPGPAPFPLHRVRRQLRVGCRAARALHAARPGGALSGDTPTSGAGHAYFRSGRGHFRSGRGHFRSGRGHFRSGRGHFRSRRGHFRWCHAHFR